jgi:hypothetical protein
MVITSFIDALYFTLQTVVTNGFGDIVSGALNHRDQRHFSIACAVLGA